MHRAHGAQMKDVFGLKYGLPPVYSPECRVLILGSFPSVLSRGNFYYGNPRNRFWHMLGEIYGESVPADKEGRARFLLAHKIALWDMVKECEIAGSSDSDLKNLTRENINDIPSLISGGAVEKILCNGGKSYSLYKKYFAGVISLPYFLMPSTSPANFAFDADKWRRALPDK